MKTTTLMTCGLAVSMLSLAVGCAPRLEATDNGPIDAPEPDAPNNGGIPNNPDINHTENSDGSFTSRVDASDLEAWIYLDLESLAQVSPAEPENSPEWDMGFQRFKVKVNGGISGRGGVRVARLENQDYDSLTVAPSAADYITDEDDSAADEDTDPDLAFLVEEGWYAYDDVDHILTPKDIVYVVKTVEDNYFKIKFLTYYDDAGSSGYPKFRWGPIEPPDGSDVDPDEGLGDGQLINANGGWVYLDLSTGDLVRPEDPLADDTWDLGFNRFMVQTNSGTSGGALGGAMYAPLGDEFDAIEQAPTVGHLTDDILEIEGAHPGAGSFSGHPLLADWFNYNVETHILTTKTEIFLIRGGDGDYYKFQVTGYNSGRYTLVFAPVDRSLTTEEAAVSTDAGPTYFSLRLGTQVEPEDPATSLDWDLAFDGTTIRTNGGASGVGQGAAAAPEAAGLDDIAEAPAEGFVEDGEEGNEALAAWFEAPEEGQVVPTARPFVVRTAEGGAAKIQFTTFEGGSLGFTWVYAGAGRGDF